MASREEQKLEAALKEATEKLVEQNEFIKQLTAPPMALAQVVAINDDTVVVSAAGGLLEVLKPKTKLSKKLDVGVTVRISPKAMTIIDVYPHQKAFAGSLFLVKRKVSEHLVEIDIDGSPRLLTYKLALAPEEGDRVMVDGHMTAVIENLGKDNTAFKAPIDKITTTWNDIGGLEHAKKDMVEAIELPVKHADLYKAYGKKPIKGVLLYGPPGCGKTLLGKAAATALAKLHGAAASEGFIYVKGPEILNMYVGNSEAAIRNLFKRAKDHKKKTGYPAVLFIDEADAILGKRGSGRSSDMERTIVPMFLAEMDGMDESGAMVLLATNRPDTLDPAIVRDGRIDRKVRVSRPTKEMACDIFKIHLNGKPFASGAVAEAAKHAAEELFSPARVLYHVKVKGVPTPLLLGNLASGAMVAGIVDKATSIALERDRDNGGKAMGITLDDLTQAIDKTFAQNMDVDHTEDVENLHEVARVSNGHNAAAAPPPA